MNYTDWSDEELGKAQAQFLERRQNPRWIQKNEVGFIVFLLLVGGGGVVSLLERANYVQIGCVIAGIVGIWWGRSSDASARNWNKMEGDIAREVQLRRLRLRVASKEITEENFVRESHWGDVRPSPRRRD